MCRTDHDVHRTPIAVVLILLFLGRVSADTPEELFAAGNKNAREGQYAEALSAWKRGYELTFSEFRDVKFLFPVQADFLQRADLSAKLLEIFQKEMPDEEILRQQKTMAAFGLLPPDLDLKKTMMDLLTEQIAGFYDPDMKRLYLIREGGAEEKRLWWEKLLGTGKSFDPDEQKATLIHEMSHALMDQHHDLLSMMSSVEEDDDMLLAVQALVEGEATLCMLVGPSSRKDLLRSSPAVIDATMSLLMPIISVTSGSGFRRAPRVLRESLIFPYFKGLTFCISLTNPEGSWEPVDRAFASPPISTEMILHPEKYPGDVPVELAFSDLLADLGGRWTAVNSNVLGEFQIRLVLSETLSAAVSEKAAAGWDGDFYRVYELPATGGPPSGTTARTVLMWASTWDTEGDAAEFQAAMVDSFAGRRGKEPSERRFGRLGRETSIRSWTTKGRRTAVFRSGADVWVIDGVPSGKFLGVAQKMMELRRRPKVYRLEKATPTVEFSEKARNRVKRL